MSDAPSTEPHSHYVVDKRTPRSACMLAKTKCLTSSFYIRTFSDAYNAVIKAIKKEIKKWNKIKNED